MKIFLLILAFPYYSMAQYRPNEKIPFLATVVSDSGTIKGYFVSSTDSTITISTTKRYLDKTSFNIPVNSISKLQLKNKPVSTIGLASGAFLLGFILTAGLTKNGGDFNNDGKTSFSELIVTAIEGSTSRNRRRRNTALIVGAAGGTTAVIIGLVANKKLSLVFPIHNRTDFYHTKKAEINNYIRF
ncbi:MAG: hypothetical protein ABI685_02325 [Ferruginibacter sp.]